MTEIPISALQALAGDISEKIEYWREYKGEKVTIEYTEFTVIEGPINPVKVSHGVDGVIADVRSLPPGFMLKDAVEFVNIEDVDFSPFPEGGSKSWDKGDMFVSFDSIERMVFDAAENK